MRRVVWSPRALHELERYLDWAGRDDPEVSIKLRREIDEWIATVAAHLLGTVHRASGLKTHSCKRRNRRIYYRVFDAYIDIATFRDMRQSPETLRLPRRRK